MAARLAALMAAAAAIPDHTAWATTMKTISFRNDTYPLALCAHGARQLHFHHALLIAIAITVPTACSDDTTCADTATCPPSGDDGGSSPESGLPDRQPDRLDADDSSAAADIRTDTNRDSAELADTRIVDGALDAGADVPPRDTSGPGRGDVSTDALPADVSMDTRRADVAMDTSMDTPAPDIYVVDMSNESSVRGDSADIDAVDGRSIDVSTPDTSDSGGTVDVVVGCTPTTCPAGCCDSSNHCITTPSDAACGSGGAACKACGSGLECNGSSCVCTSSSCTAGCCSDAVTCLPFAQQSDGQCGAGKACSSCAAAMQSCNKTNGLCTCTPASCPAGCCDGNACLPYANQNDSACGSGGATCGSCGAGKYCDSKGACLASTWCKTQVLPSGVMTEDYQCLDFDSGMPPANTWVPNVKETGVLELVTDQVRSTPNSLHSIAWATPPEVFAPDIAHLTWTSSGNLISSVNLATDAYFRETYGGYANGYVDYLCVTLGGTKACLSYRYPDSDTFSVTFPTLPPPKPFCDFSYKIDYQQWTHIEMSLSNNGVLTINADGTVMACPSGVTVSSGVSSVQIGAESIEPRNWGEVRLDNVVAYIRR